MSKSVLFAVSLTALAGMLVNPSAAQVPRFFSADANLFDPEIGIIQTGAITDAQAVVSHDQKYVTLNMGASQSNLLTLREFSTEKGSLPTGFVGESGFTRPKADPAALRNPQPSRLAAPTDTVLRRSGVVLLARIGAGEEPSQFTRPAVR